MACPYSLKPMANGRISKSWSQRLLINGKPVNVGLGSYPVVSLAQARQKALENKQALVMGKDIRKHTPTFREAAEIVIAIHREGWKDSGKSENHWQASLRDYAYPTLANKKVDQITTADVMGVLLPCWQSKFQTMKKLKQRIAIVMRWAVAKGYRQDDPTAALDAVLPKHNGAIVQHQKSVHHSEVGAAIAKDPGVRDGYWANQWHVLNF